MSRFLQVYEPDTGLMLTQESVDFMLSKSDPEFIVATEGFGDIMKKIWDAIVKFFKWLIEKIQKLYNRMKEFVKGLVKKKEQIKQEQKEREKKALDKIANDTVGGHEKAANELMDDLHKSADKMKKTMADADKKSSGGLKPKDYYDKRREEAHAEFKKADADMMDALDKTAKATAAVHDAATGKKEAPKPEPKKAEPPKPEPPKDESFDVDGLIFNYKGNEFDKAIDDGLKGLEKVILLCKKVLSNIKVDISNPDNAVNNNDDKCYEPIFKILNTLRDKYKIGERTDAKWGSSKDGGNSMHFKNIDELADVVEKRMMPSCKELHKMLNKIILFFDEVAKKDCHYDHSLENKYGERARNLNDVNLTEKEREMRAMFSKLRRSFKSIGETSTRIYNVITHDYHKMNNIVFDKKYKDW